VTVVGVVWAAFEFLNISWPRAVYPERYLDWSVWIVIVVLGVAGAVVFAGVRRGITAVNADDDEDAVVKSGDLSRRPR